MVLPVQDQCSCGSGGIAAVVDAELEAFWWVLLLLSFEVVVNTMVGVVVVGIDQNIGQIDGLLCGCIASILETIDKMMQ